MTGATIGPYRVVRELGQGGMGTVVLAEDTRLGRHVALKMVSGSQAGTTGGRAQLLDEARAAAAISHPAIAGVYDVIEHEGDIAIVFEFVEGETLAARLTKGPLPEAQAIQIAIQLADALNVAHGHHVLHRDLKPSNVMLAPGGVVKILDFGIARFRPVGQPDAGAGGDEGFMGTPGYVAPEQWAGKPADERSDLYALGVVLFEMVSGKRPFPEREPFTLARASIERIARRLSTLAPAVSPGLDKLVARLLAADPALRPPRARVVADELRTLLAPPAPPAALPWRRWLATAAVAVAAVGGVVWALTRPVKLDVTNPVIAVLPFKNATGNSGDDYLAAGVADSLAASLTVLPTVRLVARSAVDDARRRLADPAEVARDLGATFVVDGTIERERDQLRLVVSLRMPDATVPWTERVEGPPERVFELQARLADALGSALSVQMSEEDRARRARPPTASPVALDAYWRGRAALERRDTPGNLDRAILAFGEALRLDPRFADAQAALGEAYAAQYASTRDAKAIEQAIQASRNATALAPADPSVRLALGITLVSSGRHAEAVQELQRALAQQPSLDDARRHLGNALAGLGRIDEAIAEWQKAIEARPNNWQVFSDMGRLLFDAARYDQARQALAQLVVLQPDNAFGFQQLGTVYQVQRDFDRALESYARATAIAPTARLLANMGALYHVRGRFAEAIDSYQRSITLGPRLAATHRNLGDTLLRVGRTSDAAASYARAVELGLDDLRVSPGDAKRLASLALFSQKAGDGAAAERYLGQALTKAPDDVQVCYRAAGVYALAGRQAQALDALEKAIALGYSKPDAESDDDFRTLRAVPRFAALFSGASAASGGR